MRHDVSPASLDHLERCLQQPAEIAQGDVGPLDRLESRQALPGLDASDQRVLGLLGGFGVEPLAVSREEEVEELLRGLGVAR